jgi:hypothetical protein
MKALQLRFVAIRWMMAFRGCVRHREVGREHNCSASFADARDMAPDSRSTRWLPVGG